MRGSVSVGARYDSHTDIPPTNSQIQLYISRRNLSGPLSGHTDLVLPWCAMSRTVVSVVPMADVGDERRRWGCRGRVVERDCGVDLS